MRLTLEKFLRRAAWPRGHVKKFLDPEERLFARFDPELGYVPRNSCIADGMGGAYCLYRYEPEGHRCVVNFRDAPCRINTYGNSFTQCHQVSDGETWQEVLAANYCEPIRNFGVGGHGAYQAYLRMKRIESTGTGSPWVVLNLWGDDHQRSLMAWRWLSYYDTWEQAHHEVMFHGNPWAHVRIDPENGELAEHPNPFPEPEDLFRLCDADYAYERFRDDVIVHIMAALRGAEVPTDQMKALADCLGVSVDFSDEVSAIASADRLFHAAAARATVHILRRARAWLEERGKKLMVLLSYPEEQVRNACSGRDRHDQNTTDWHPKEIRDVLRNEGFTWLDTLPCHVKDFGRFRLTPEEYVKQYFIGHYNPHGNHFFAWAVRDALAEWLEPAPPALTGGEIPLRFSGYLPAARK